MTTSIYFSVKQKLIGHGAHKSRDGRIVFQDRCVFLKFVRLERAIRAADFEAVQSTVNELEEYVSSLGKRHLVVFAYMYIRFSDGSPKRGKITREEDESVVISHTYRRSVTEGERLIADWGRHMYFWLGHDLLRLVYLSNHERHHKNSPPSTFEPNLPDHR